MQIQSHPQFIYMLSGDPFRLSTGQIIGIVIGILVVIVAVILFINFYIKPRWPQRHQYGWYNTLTTPSKWCSCCCQQRHQRRCTCRCTSRQRTRQPSRSTEPTDNDITVEPSVAEPSDPGLSKATPPSYEAASNISAEDTKSELPPPYPGGPGPTYPPSWTNPAYPPPSGFSEPGESTPYPTWSISVQPTLLMVLVQLLVFVYYACTSPTFIIIMKCMG